jgi:hypothetical protein
MVSRFANRCTAIVAGKTGANDFVMIDPVWCPACKAMAAFTDIRGSDMCRLLADGDYVVMADDTVAGYILMMEPRIKPGRSCMAIVAIIAALHVIPWLSGCNTTVMATETTA